MPKTTRPRKQKTEDPRDIDSTLEDMYQQDDGTLPDMTHIDSRKSHAGLMVAFFILFFLAAAAAAAWLGFFLFSPTQKFSESHIVAEIKPPAEITNGIEQNYEISIKNKGTLALANTRIVLKLPENFLITEAVPKALT